MQAPRYRIHRVAQLTGVHPSTLRAWERRYGLLEPQRTPAGHRLYSDADVARVRRVAGLAADGIPYDRIGRLLEQEEPPPAALAATSDLVETLRDRARRHVSGFDLAGLEDLYRQAVVALSVGEALERVLLPVLVELGDRWHEGAGIENDDAGGTDAESADIVAEEHFLSGFVQRKILAFINSLGRQRDRPRVICAVAPQDAHEIGLLQFVLRLVARGISVTYLGPATPYESVLRVARATSPAAVCLAVTVADETPDLARLLDELCRLPGAPAVILGGRGAARMNGTRMAAAVTVAGTDLEAGIAETLAATGAA